MSEEVRIPIDQVHAFDDLGRASILIADLQQQLDAMKQRIKELEASIVEATQRHSTTFDRHVSELHKRLDSDDRVGELEAKLEAAKQRNGELTDELEDLRSGGISAAESCCGSTKRILVQRAETAERNLATAQTALDKYGNHSAMCPRRSCGRTAETVCVCGYDKALQRLRAERMKSRLMGLCEGFDAGASADVKAQEEEISRLEQQLEAAERNLARARDALIARQRLGHHDTCEKELSSEYECSCGFEIAQQALAQIEQPR